jgi:hypothetical protein
VGSRGLHTAIAFDLVEPRSRSCAERALARALSSTLRSLGAELDRSLVESELDTLDRELADTSIAAPRARVFGNPG